MNQWSNSSQTKAFGAEFLRCSSDSYYRAQLELRGHFLRAIFLPSHLLFSFGYSVLIALLKVFFFPNCFLKVFLHFLFCLLPFLLSHYLLPLPHQQSICKVEQVQQTATKMIRELDHMTYEKKLRPVFIMEKRCVAGGLIIVFSYLKMCYRKEGDRFLEA